MLVQSYLPPLVVAPAVLVALLDPLFVVHPKVGNDDQSKLGTRHCEATDETIKYVFGHRRRYLHWVLMTKIVVWTIGKLQ